jgi:hypothetical protein
MEANNLLNYLLTVDDVRLGSLKASLAGTVPLFLDATTGDGTPLLRIYSIKAGLAKDRGRHTEGFGDLLTNFPDAQNRSVTILNVGTDTKTFLIFTDAETKRIFGVLSADR